MLLSHNIQLDPLHSVNIFEKRPVEKVNLPNVKPFLGLVIFAFL